MTTETVPIIKLGKVEVKQPQTMINRWAIMIWGNSGAGKTTFAATAPGTKLILNFDPDGPQSLTERDDVLVADYSSSACTIIDEMQGENPLQLAQLLDSNPEIETVILDSATTLGELALERAVQMVSGPTNKITLEKPGIPGYTARNVKMLNCVRNLLRVTTRFNKHFVLICHEDTPDKNEDGVVLQIVPLLSGKLPEHVGIKFSEIWHLRDDDKKNVRFLAIRPCRSRRPMKTRAFVTNRVAEFPLNYDATQPDHKQDHTIARWFDKWKAGGGKKMDIPK